MGCNVQESLCHTGPTAKMHLAPNIHVFADTMRLSKAQGIQRVGHKQAIEPRISTSVGLRKPDLLVYDGVPKIAYVVNHTLVWESPHPLEFHSKNKGSYCQHGDMVNKIKAVFPDASDVKFRGFVISAWGKSNDAFLHELGLTRALADRTISIPQRGSLYCSPFGGDTN